MAKEKELRLRLPSADSLFSTEAEREEEKRERVQSIPLSELRDFPHHPFQVRLDAAMEEMAESVSKYGVLSPAIVRPSADGGYEMIAGHRRKQASEMAGNEEMPCIVRELTDDEATILMVDSNLQREEILPSEKAWAYRMKLEAMNRQAGRPGKSNLTPMVSDSRGIRTNELLARQVGESRENIRRYIRLTELVPDLLEMVDTGKVAFRPAVELSYLSEEQQISLLAMMKYEECTPSLSQSIKMKKFSQEGRLNEDVILSILSEEKPNQQEKIQVPKDRISKFFPPGTTPKKMEETIVKALEIYHKHYRNRDNRGR